MSNKQITMYDYILEERSVLLKIIENRKTIFKEIAGFFKSNPVSEIIICGSGTSYHAGLATRKLFEDLLGIRVRAEFPMIFTNQQTIYQPNTLFIAISQGGQSTSTIQALKKAKEGLCSTVGISENPNAEILKNSDMKILMECGPELSIAKTKGYVASICIFHMIALEVALELKKISSEKYKEYIDAYLDTVNNFDKIIEAGHVWVNANGQSLIESRKIVVLGYSNHFATALEGALKMLETMRFGIYAYELEEFCHGIPNAIDKDTSVIYIAATGDEQAKALRVKNALANRTSRQHLIVSPNENIDVSSIDCVIPFKNHKYFDVLEYIIPLQIASSMLPYKLGIDPFYPSDPTFHKKVGSK